MYSIPDPPFIEAALPHLGSKTADVADGAQRRRVQLPCTIRGYARAFIRNIPSPDKVSEFWMGPDGYNWGPDFLSRNAQNRSRR
jgi:hypothetical protein